MSKKTDVQEPVQETPVTETKPEPVIGVVIDCAKLNIRKKPNTNGEVLCTVNVGSKLTIKNADAPGNWYKVTTENGVAGFCMKKYVSVEQ